MTPPEQQADDQPALLPQEVARASVRAARKRPRPAQALTPAAHEPVARVLVEVPLAHLDRPFDYLVPEKYAADAVPGARVKVRFAGQDVDGFVVQRSAASEHPGRLQPLRRVVSAEPVLSPEIAELSRLVADRQAGTRSDVLRLAVPPRHAATEKRPSEPAPPSTVTPDPTPWKSSEGGEEFLSAVAQGASPRAVWTALPGDDWTTALAEVVVATAASGRGALVCVPDHRDITRLDRALRDRLGKGHHVVLTAEAGPAKRYRAFLAVSRGACKVVIGTRAAAFAPVADLGLVAIWDDGDDLYAEPRAPYPHTREVLLLRADQQRCAVLLGSFARSVEAQYLVRTGWARELAPSRAGVRRRVAVSVAGASDLQAERDPGARTARLPSEALAVIRKGLETGPVLVQTPRAGYATRLTCETCRARAQCPACQGPLRIPGPGRPPECAWCAHVATRWSCPTCGGRGLRAPVLGDRRTAEEIGRALPGVAVRTSSGGEVLASVPDRPEVVVATAGAEPIAARGYAAVLLLDTWLPLARSDLRAAEEAVRRWAGAAALVAAEGGPWPVLLVGEPAVPALQAMVRWDPAGFAEREIDERQSAHLPPASRMATLTAAAPEIEALLATDLPPLPPGAEVLGPVRVDVDDLRLVVRVPRAAGPALSAALREMQAARSARKLPHIRIHVDPRDLD